MKHKGALLLFVFILFIVLIPNTEKRALIGDAGSEINTLTDDVKECEITYNNSGKTYRDGLVDNFDYFKSNDIQLRTEKSAFSNNF